MISSFILSRLKYYCEKTFENCFMKFVYDFMLILFFLFLILFVFKDIIELGKGFLKQFDDL